MMLCYIGNMITLKALYLDVPNCTDAGLASLRSLTALQRLVMCETPITDSGVDHLVCLSQHTIIVPCPYNYVMCYNTIVTINKSD
jgi:hypothetical protein